jgi:hypothetical protein
LVVITFVVGMDDDTVFGLCTTIGTTLDDDDGALVEEGVGEA